MIKQMTDMQLLARIIVLDKRAMEKYLLETINKHLATKTTKMDYVAKYKYLMDNANFLYADWLSDKESLEYENILKEIEKRDVDLLI